MNIFRKALPSYISLKRLMPLVRGLFIELHSPLCFSSAYYYHDETQRYLLP